MICEDTDPLYTIRPAAIDADAAYIAVDATVFLTKDVGSVRTTSGSFVRTEREASGLVGLEEVSDLVVSTGLVAGGWLTGRLETLRTTLGLS